MPSHSNTYYIKGLLDYAIKVAATWVACKKLHARIARPFKGLLDYAIKIAATWVACKKLHTRIARLLHYASKTEQFLKEFQ